MTAMSAGYGVSATMIKYPTLTIRLPQETLHWLKVEAELQDKSNAQIVKQALDLYYQTQHPTD
jgi:predicted DNA-binding protein